MYHGLLSVEEGILWTDAERNAVGDPDILTEKFHRPYGGAHAEHYSAIYTRICRYAHRRSNGNSQIAGVEYAGVIRMPVFLFAVRKAA